MACVVEAQPIEIRTEIDLSGLGWTLPINTRFNVDDLKIKLVINPKGTTNETRFCFIDNSHYAAAHFRVIDAKQDDDRLLIVSLKCGSETFTLPPKKASDFYYDLNSSPRMFGLSKTFKAELLKSVKKVEITARLCNKHLPPTEQIVDSSVARLKKMYELSRNDGDVTLIVKLDQDEDEDFDVQCSAIKETEKKS